MKEIGQKLDADAITKHKIIIQQLTSIIAKKPPQRMTTQSPQRVASTSTSVNITAPLIIHTAKRVHQRQMMTSTPMPTIVEEEEHTLEQNRAKEVLINN